MRNRIVLGVFVAAIVISGWLLTSKRQPGPTPDFSSQPEHEQPARLTASSLLNAPEAGRNNGIAQVIDSSDSGVRANSSGPQGGKLGRYVIDRHIGGLIDQLNQSSDPANWFVSNALNLWCASAGLISPEAEKEILRELGAQSAQFLASVKNLKVSCEHASNGLAAAPNVRYSDLKSSDARWAAARGLETLRQSNETEGRLALLELGKNSDLVVSWLSVSSMSLSKAPVLESLPPDVRASAVALAMCAESPQSCQAGGLISVHTCILSGFAWCTGSSVDEAVLNALPKEHRVASQQASQALLDAIKRGQVNALVRRP